VNSRHGWVSLDTGFFETEDGAGHWKELSAETLDKTELPSSWPEGKFRRIAILLNANGDHSVRKTQQELEESATSKVFPSAVGLDFPPSVNYINVDVEVTVDESGSVESARVVEPNPPEFMLRAIDAAKEWKFKVTIVDGVRRRATGKISFLTRHVPG
jgi:TonB family protein